MKNFLIAFLFLIGFCSNGQEFNGSVTVDARQTGQTRLRIFKILEESVEEFINQTAFGNTKFSEQQKIECSFFITINSFDSDNFSGNIQVQASRPIFGGIVKTNLINVRDQDFNFKYTESQPLIFDLNNYQSNLTSVVSFYLLTILGLDADSFELNGGEEYHQLARQVVNITQPNAGAGWQQTGVGFSRFNLNNDLLSQNFSRFREVFYDYHRNGLDLMHKDTKTAKDNILESITTLKAINDERPNSVLMRLFLIPKQAKYNKYSVVDQK